MLDNFYFDINIIKTLTHKTEKPGFYFNRQFREWDGFILLTDGNADFEKHNNKKLNLYKGDIVFHHKGDRYAIKSKNGLAAHILQVLIILK